TKVAAGECGRSPLSESDEHGAGAGCAPWLAGTATDEADAARDETDCAHLGCELLEPFHVGSCEHKADAFPVLSETLHPRASVWAVGRVDEHEPVPRLGEAVVLYRVPLCRGHV